MKLRLLIVLVFGSLASALLVTAGSAATTVFATGMVVPETITQTASGNFFVTDANAGEIWEVSASGETVTQKSSFPDSLRGGLILPSTFGSVGGKFLVVGVNT